MVSRVVAAAVIVIGLGVRAAVAGPAVEIRFYSINDKQQQRELSVIFNRDEPGCHNTPGSPDVYRVAQVGFAHCTVYSAEDCEPGSELVVKWDGRTRKGSKRAEPGTLIYPGSEWLFPDKLPREVESWSCTP